MESLGLWTILKLTLTFDGGVIIFNRLFKGFEAKKSLNVKKSYKFLEEKRLLRV